MQRSPYRTPAEPDELSDDGARDHADGELLPVFALVWAVSVIRVVGAFCIGETMGAEPTIATLVVVLLPSMVWRPVLSLSRRSLRPYRRRGRERCR
jgi:hypothetical protein